MNRYYRHIYDGATVLSASIETHFPEDDVFIIRDMTREECARLGLTSFDEWQEVSFPYWTDGKPLMWHYLAAR